MMQFQISATKIHINLNPLAFRLKKIEMIDKMALECHGHQPTKIFMMITCRHS